ncbi:hypothetical protein Hamer_G027304 [Homarus americanus]|uniref:Uncharacterized protein n=1 Tax=Homarus americanus TaxID=6706 RepID=A0A8J5JST8_HOMAM|nr:hypothetical protein Hamer_G014058 [Homarus americanus]KAG7166887.1 hypothetical protein Hamer_G027304 [Homarus americanus]
MKIFCFIQPLILISDDEYNSDDYEDIEESESDASAEEISSEEEETSNEESPLGTMGWKEVIESTTVNSPTPPPFDFIAKNGMVSIILLKRWRVF